MIKRVLSRCEHNYIEPQSFHRQFHITLPASKNQFCVSNQSPTCT